MMWSSMRSTVASLVWGSSLVHSAMNIDGTQAVAPLTEADPSPIDDMHTYYPDQHDCPVPCIDYSNTHSWITYLSVDRLRRCQEPMLLQFSITQPLDDPAFGILIRSCSFGSGSDTNATFASPMKNPKKAKYLFQPSLDFAPACTTNGKEIQEKLELATSTGSIGDKGEVVGMLEGMQQYFDAKDNCDENFLFAYHKEMVASIYIGAGLGKPTVQSALRASVGRLGTGGSRTVAQLCGGGRLPDRVFGISIDTSGNLAAVQKTALEWSKGICAEEHLKSTEVLPNVKVLDLAGSSNTSISNSTLISDKASSSSRLQRKWTGNRRNGLKTRATCRYTKVVSGDSCGALVARCGISSDDLSKFNPKSNLCASLMPGDYICCSAGDPYTLPKPPKPQPQPDGTCASHLIKNGDTCRDLALQYGVTIEDLEKWNKSKTWAWSECKDMLVGYSMCVSDGSALMPPPQQGTQCGPLVPGTQKPTNKSVSLADLNPCPLKTCCSNWGYCGVFPGHCEIHAPKGGSPGSKEKNFQNTCISGCGSEIKQNSGPPAAFQRIVTMRPNRLL